MYNVVTSYIKLKIRPGIYTSCSFYTHQNVNKYGGWIMKQVISNLGMFIYLFIFFFITHGILKQIEF